MTYLATLQTRMAQADKRQADAGECEHLRDCITCRRATQHRAPGDRCPEGRELYEARTQAAAKLKAERALDRQVPPGQMALF